MSFQITRDKDGKPIHVVHNTGFLIRSGPFDPAQDGWMETQMNPADFPAIQIGRDTEYLVAEVNRLRRELWHKEQLASTYHRGAGF